MPLSWVLRATTFAQLNAPFSRWSHAQRPGIARRLLALVTAPWFPGPVAAADWLAATLGVMHGAPLLTDFTEFHVVCDKERTSYLAGPAARSCPPAGLETTFFYPLSFLSQLSPS